MLKPSNQLNVLSSFFYILHSGWLIVSSYRLSPIHNGLLFLSSIQLNDPNSGCCFFFFFFQGATQVVSSEDPLIICEQCTLSLYTARENTLSFHREKAKMETKFPHRVDNAPPSPFFHLFQSVNRSPY